MSAAATAPEKLDTQTAPQRSNLAVMKTDVVDKTADLLRNHINTGRLHLPADYSIENALKSAWLAIQEVEDKNRRPALEVCTKVSVVNALMAMAVQGLDPMKKQCYFIVYGRNLVCQRSYFGEMALAKRIRPGISFGYQCWYEGDEIGYEIVNGKIVSIRHKQDVKNVSPDRIAGAYCLVIDEESGGILFAEAMPIERIKRSWAKSKTYKPDDPKATHNEFADEMAMRTVIRKTCKPIINSSSDALLLQHVQSQELDAVDSEVAEDAAEYANQELLSLPDEPGVDRVDEAAAAGDSQPTLQGAGDAGEGDEY